MDGRPMCTAPKKKSTQKEKRELRVQRGMDGGMRRGGGGEGRGKRERVGG